MLLGKIKYSKELVTLPYSKEPNNWLVTARYTVSEHHFLSPFYNWRCPSCLSPQNSCNCCNCYNKLCQSSACYVWHSFGLSVMLPTSPCLLDGRVFLFKLKMQKFLDNYIDGVSVQFKNEFLYRVSWCVCPMLHVDSNLKFRYVYRVDQRTRPEELFFKRFQTYFSSFDIDFTNLTCDGVKIVMEVSQRVT